MVSKHYESQRYDREKFIEEHLGGDGCVVDSFVVDKGHKNGLERHDITSHGIIVIYNNNSNILVSKLIARPSQIKRYYEKTGREPPLYLIDLARQHQYLGYNYE